MSNRRKLRPSPAVELDDDLDYDDEDLDEDGSPCTDCGTPTFSLEPDIPAEWYKVLDDVWETADGPDPGFLHIRCLEARLGRQLHRGDFEPGLPVNDPDMPRSDVAWTYRTRHLQNALSRIPAS